MKIVIVGAGRAGLEVRHPPDAHRPRRDHRRQRRARRRGAPSSSTASWRSSGDATIAAVLEEADDRAERRGGRHAAARRRQPGGRAPGARRRRRAGDGAHARQRLPARSTPTAGIDRVLSETDLITGSIATAVEHDAIRHAMLIGDGGAIAFELTIPDGQRRRPGRR